MNLTTGKWIPVVWEDGRPDKVSLLDVFQQGDRIQDLAVRPHERIALMRLLICIAQAALDGPKDHEEWKGCGTVLPAKAAAYLAKWKDAFELFGEGQRFLQVPADGSAPAALDKLDFVDAEMPTLFNQDVTPGRAFDEDWIVFRLLTYQAFAAGGCCGGSFKDEAGRLKPQKGKNGPCRDGSAFHCYLRASDLLQTVRQNLITVEDVAMLKPLVWGRPIWELVYRSLAELAKHSDVVTSYLGRLVPVSRSLWLMGDRRTVLTANGLKYPGLSSDGVRLEPAIAVRQHIDNRGVVGRRPVTAKAGESMRHPWRELQAVLMLQRDGCGGPLTLRNVDDSGVFDLWLGAFVTDQSKVDDSVEFVFARLPSEMLSDPRVQNAYSEGVSFSSQVEARLRNAMKCYRVVMETLVGDESAAERKFSSMRRADKERFRAIMTPLLSSYWTRLETRVGDLARGAADRDLSRWKVIVCGAARAAYEIACPHETPRQLKAYSLGLNALFKPVEKDEDEPDNEGGGES